jgi:predicted acetyltransferase
LIKLLKVTPNAPPGALDVLTALGSGENGFGGTPVGVDPGKLKEWLKYCQRIAKVPPLSEDFPVQINYWVVNESGLAIGLIRLFPQLNNQLLNRGGHLGYYIAPDYRNRGFGSQALRSGIKILHDFGVESALVTVDTNNALSLRMVHSLGGNLEDERVDSETGQAFRRFWLSTIPTLIQLQVVPSKPGC